MADREPVEKFKLTKEMVKFTKNLGQLHKISKMLQGKFELQLGEAQQTRALLQQVEGGVQELMYNAPQQPTKNIEGQEQDTEVPAKNFQLQY